MKRPRVRGRRAGITLTEILISILIMGVGMLSLATLFPLGLTQLRNAARSSRSALLSVTAASEIASRDLLYKPSFQVVGYPFDVFTEDPASVGDVTAGITTGIDRVSFNPAYTGRVGGTGLPVCYDPLWWYQVYVASGGATQPSLTAGAEFRFGSGIGLLRNDPAGGPPSAHGLQRVTNFPFTLDPASVFASQDDIVMQTDGTQSRNPNGTPNNTSGRGNPTAPDLSTNALLKDLSYTWIFTGRQTDVTNGTIFDGDIVIFHNRPFATDIRPGGVNAAAGETVVEAIWGYGSVPADPPSGGGLSPTYSRNDRSVLLRWPNSQADPDVRVGGFIADVTYERYSGTEVARWYSDTSWGTYYPAQRCYWYRVAKKTDVTSDHDTNLAGYREMTVMLSSPVRARTPIATGGIPTRLNAALVSPYIVNVVSRVFYTR